LSAAWSCQLSACSNKRNCNVTAAPTVSVNSRYHAPSEPHAAFAGAPCPAPAALSAVQVGGWVRVGEAATACRPRAC
jgi:hypothetical protein